MVRSAFITFNTVYNNKQLQICPYIIVGAWSMMAHCGIIML